MTDILENLLSDVRDEVLRQRTLKLQGRFSYTPADTDVSEMSKLAMLMEEVGEVGRNLMNRAGIVADGDGSNDALVKELKQVAAVAVAWMTSYEYSVKR